MDRRQFIATMGGAAAVTGLALQGCSNNQTESSEAAALGEIPTDRMEYRTGVHGEKVSLLGYGCMRWPELPNGQTIQDGPAKGSNLDQQKVNELVDYAMAHGVNYYDTSPAYCRGFSEQVTGVALSRYPRESYMVATKMSNFDPSTHSLEASKQMFLNSLKYLQVDYIDFYLLHAIGGGGMDNLRKRFLDNGVLDYLLKEREAGRIRNLGFSFHGDIEVFDYMMQHHPDYHWDFVQIQLNYVDWQNGKLYGNNAIDADYLYHELEKRGIPAVIMEPLLGGRLATLNDHAVSLLKAREPQRSIASWAFRFAGHEKGTLTVLSGMTYMDHLQDNLRSYAPYEDLTEEELALLEKIALEYAQFPLVPCTGCQYCMPCPYGIDIPGIFKHYNRCLNEGRVQENPADPEYRKLRREYLISYARKLAPERQADHCTGCGKCKSHCPQRIDIPQQMQRIDHYVEQLKNNL